MALGTLTNAGSITSITKTGLGTLLVPVDGYGGALNITGSSNFGLLMDGNGTGAPDTLTYGGAWGYPDPLAAYKRSLSECNKAAGSNDCVVKVTLKDNCGALAISVVHNASFLVQGRDQVTATATAMEQCHATGAGDSPGAGDAPNMPAICTKFGMRLTRSVSPYGTALTNSSPPAASALMALESSRISMTSSAGLRGSPGSK